MGREFEYHQHWVVQSINGEGIGIPSALGCAVLIGRGLEYHQHWVVQSINGEGIGIPPAPGCAEY